MATAGADPANFLRATFQIGSAQGRLDYEETERVFHTADVPARAKEARKWVQTSKRSTTLMTTPPFNLSTYTGATISGTRPAGWDKKGHVEERSYARMDVEARLERETQRRERHILGQEDSRNVNPSWNASTLVGPRRAPPTDNFFSEEGHRANDLSRSLRFGNESFIVVPPHKDPDGTMETLPGGAQLGTGLPYVEKFDPNETEVSRARKPKTKLPIDYKSLVERERRHAEKMRAEKRAARAAVKPKPALIRHEPTFTFPDEYQWEGTKFLTEDQVEERTKSINATFTKDALEEYLKTMELKGAIPLAY